ncbi:MAG TPA: squalene--hopene cyclase, partial [Desulfobulbaceae bacterium]|nr:squalene--hopene cyclase [Desulfobulbaceae bacterium]
LDPDAAPLKTAREWIVNNGGLAETRVFTRYWLALLGEWPWQYTPALPPEIIFIPPWAPFNLYKFASWARATLLPLTILSARRPIRPLPPEKKLDELFPDGRTNFDFRLPRKKGVFSWERFFLVTDYLLNRYVTFPVHPFRETAIRSCREWIIGHQDADGAWGGIQPPWIYSLMALGAEEYALDHPVMAAGLNGFNLHWSYERNGGIYLQPSESPIWDTVLSLLAFLDCGMPPGTLEAAEKAVDYLLREQVLVGGDWQVFVKDAEPGGWAFEFENDKYPDVDDTAVAVIVLLRLLPLMKDTALQHRMQTAVDRAVAWMLAMQNPNGGWAAFDRDNTSKILTLIPFADFGELLDPPSVDVTAHVVEALGLYGHNLESPAVARACRYMQREQEEDGSWFGRWGVNYIYGTAAVLPALEMVGENMQAEYIQRAARWLIEHQNKDGGWGESCGSYMDDDLRGRGPSTASQTGWALMALLAASSGDFDQSIQQGLNFLCNSQRQDGTWDEPQYTGTGFPGYGVGERVNLAKDAGRFGQGRELARAFMLNYNLYRHYFPLIAMGRAQNRLNQATTTAQHTNG